MAETNPHAASPGHVAGHIAGQRLLQGRLILKVCKKVALKRTMRPKISRRFAIVSHCISEESVFS